MRRTLLTILAILACLPAFGLTENMQIRGYYNSTSTGSSVEFALTESVSGQNKSLLYSFVDLTDECTEQAVEIFAWSLSGKTRNTVSVTFTFFPLQALVNGYYYQPSYTITMTKNDTKIGTTTNTNDDFIFSGSSTFSKTIETRDASVYINGFNTENTITYAGKVKSNFTQNATWTRSGTCKIQITDYEKYIAGTFDYTCNVTVTYTTT